MRSHFASTRASCRPFGDFARIACKFITFNNIEMHQVIAILAYLFGQSLASLNTIERSVATPKRVGIQCQKSEETTNDEFCSERNRPPSQG